LQIPSSPLEGNAGAARCLCQQTGAAKTAGTALAPLSAEIAPKAKLGSQPNDQKAELKHSHAPCVFLGGRLLTGETEQRYNLGMKQRTVMTLMYGIEPVGPVSALNQVDQQSIASSDYESEEPLASARAKAECIDRIIRAYCGTLPVVEQYEFWKELHRRLDH
jgi:hypothetical protein